MSDAPVKVTCPCGAPMVRRTSEYGLFYGCSTFPKCKNTHAAHQSNGDPMGKPADPETKKARIRAHAAFDQLWQPNAFSKRSVMKRKEAYSWLRKSMGLDHTTGHIAMFDIAQCERLIVLVNKRLEGNHEAKDESQAEADRAEAEGEGEVQAP